VFQKDYEPLFFPFSAQAYSKAKERGRVDGGDNSIRHSFILSLKLPPAYVNQPEGIAASEGNCVVIITDIPVDRTRARLKANTLEGEGWYSGREEGSMR
jgi:hypothetical protein